VAGRGFGKTPSAAPAFRERLRWLAEQPKPGEGSTKVRHPPHWRRRREVCVGGPDGLLATAPRGWMAKYEPTKRRALWPNDCVAILYTAQKPDQLRGPTISRRRRATRYLPKRETQLDRLRLSAASDASRRSWSDACPGTHLPRVLHFNALYDVP